MRTKKLLSILLTLAMVMSLMPTVAMAAGADLNISDEAGLRAFATEVNSGENYEGKTVKLMNDITLTAEWTPIGTGTRSGSSYTGSAFKGTFDGGGNTISGLTITTTTGADAALGLFGVVDGGTVKDLTMTGVNINVSTSECAGGVIGILTGDGEADNITVSGSVSAKRGNGGIVGRMMISGTISDCTNNADMSATGANVGGIVGAAYYTASGKTMTISGCTNNGVITSSSSGVGGIVGLSAANVSDCINTAGVTGGGFSVGGIVGEQQNYGSIVDCTNSANISSTGTSGDYGTGGIIGWIRYNGTAENYPLKGVVEVKNNANSGNVAGASDAGGIVGTVYHAAEVSGNENTAASLSATNFAGGIVANFQFSDNFYGNPIPQQELNLQNNVSTTALDNIFANCKNLYVYDNSSGAQDGTIAENSAGWVAQVGDTKYATLAGAVDAADGETVKLLDDVTLTETLTIPSGKTVTLDLNGKTISQTKAQTAGYQMILNDGNLTIKDSKDGGKITYTDTGNGGEYISDTIYNRGVLVIDGGTIENLSSSTVASNGYPHAVDTYSGIRDTSVTINGGTIYCAEYSAVRMFCVSATYKADLTINGGTIKGAVDMQNGTSDAALGSLTINDGTFETTKNANNIRFANWNGGATTYGITAFIKGGSFNGGISTQYVPSAANWNSKIITGGTFATLPDSAYLATDYESVQNAEGKYVVVPESGVTVTFDANGGTCETATGNTTDLKLTSLPTATRSGYTFNGWFTAASGGTQVTTSTEFTEDTTVYAQWTVISTSSGPAKYSITVEDADNGTVKVSPSRASKGKTVTITVTPDDRYELDELVVTDKNGDEIELTETGDGEYTFTMPSGKVEVNATFVLAETCFGDVAPDYWAAEEIEWAHHEGYIGGTSATTFSPAKNLSRQQLWMILARHSGEAPANMAEARAWAMANGVSDGSNPGSAVTRQQLVTIMYRYADMMGYDTSDEASLRAFPDRDSVAGYAEDAMSWSVANGIVGGTTAGTLNPTGNATRAHFAAILFRFCDKMM